MADRYHRNSLEFDTATLLSNGNNNLNVVGSVVNVGTLKTGAFNLNLHLRDGLDVASLEQAALNILAPSRSLGDPLFSPVACISGKRLWCEDIQSDYLPGTDVEIDFNQRHIASVYSTELGDHEERIYLVADNYDATSATPMILELRPTKQKTWQLSSHISAPNAFVGTRLAAVCMAGGTEIHLFYTTSQATIHDLIWTSRDRQWKPGSLFKESGYPKISPWSSLSVLRSANYIKLYYQRDDGIIELSYALRDHRWTFDTLFTADRGTPIASTSYTGPESTVYHVVCQMDGKLSVWKADHEGSEMQYIESPEDLPVHAVSKSLSAISWFNVRTEQGCVKVYYISDAGELCEWWWNATEEPRWHRVAMAIPRPVGDTSESPQITALQVYNGEKIRVYYVYDGMLKQVALSHRFKKGKVKSVCNVLTL